MSNKNAAESVVLKTTSAKFIWLRAFTIPLLILVIIGSFAIISGRNKTRPIDWIYVNAVAEKKNVELPDGSKIILRKGSSIAFPSNYGKTRRYVQLLGEAYFEVQYQSSMPFSVKGINQITADAGTSFLVRSNNSMELIVVTAGKVRLERNYIKGDYVTLSAGQKVELVGKQMHISSAKKTNLLAWTNEQLIFNRTSLKQVADDIYNLYGVPLYFTPDIDPYDITITAQFNNQPLSQILQSIADRSALLISQTGDSVLIGLSDNKIITHNPVPSGEKEKGSWVKRIFSKNN